MKDTQLIMGMPITVEVVGPENPDVLQECFDYFRKVDQRFSTYKSDSEVSRYNEGGTSFEPSPDLQLVLELCEATKRETDGYFDIRRPDKTIDPSGLVKGWAIQNAANQLLLMKLESFYIEAGGDVQVHGNAPDDQPWTLGIRNPFKTDEVVKVLHVGDCGIATSGSYIRGSHIYNPHDAYAPPQGVASITVIGHNVYHADRYATAAFAMGEAGIGFIQNIKGYEGYMISDNGTATFTSEFEQYVS